MRHRRGYSLVELLAVLAILSVLAVMVMPLAQMRVERERELELHRALWQIRDAIDAYTAARKSGAVLAVPGVDPVEPYPADLETLTHLFPDQRVDHRGQTLRFLRRVPRDPFADPLLPPAESWAIRSFSDDVGAAHAQTTVRGAIPDVYDVHSRATGHALDGTLLSQW